MVVERSKNIAGGIQQAADGAGFVVGGKGQNDLVSGFRLRV
jgi:hypothetical protein